MGGRMNTTTKTLSPRQRRICELAARGWPDKAICAELGMAWGTLRTQWARAFAKLGVHTRTEAALIVELGKREMITVGNLDDNKPADTTRRK